MNSITISSTKQENGLWGTPLQCESMDRYPRLSEENEMKHSALLIAIAETFRNETFEVFWSDENGFFVKLSDSGIKNLRYRNYVVNNNVLTWIEDK